jgi:hypothetical protein
MEILHTVGQDGPRCNLRSPSVDMHDDAPRIFTAQTYEPQATFCLADLDVLLKVVGDSHQRLKDLDNASRDGRVVLINNVDPTENVTGKVVFRLLFDQEPIPAAISPYCREELSNCTLDAGNGRLLLGPVPLLQAGTYEDERPTPEQIATGVGDSGTMIEIPPGAYHVEVLSVNYERPRLELIKEVMPENDLEHWNRWESWRNAGCGLGCLGSLSGILAAIVLRVFKHNQWALWLAVAAGGLLLIGFLHFWIVGRSSRYQELRRLFDAAQGEFPHGIIRLTPVDEALIGDRPAKCGWVFSA